MLTTSIFGRKKNILTKKNISTDDRKNDIIARHQLVSGYVSHVFAELAHTTLLCGPAAQKLNLKKPLPGPWEELLSLGVIFLTLNHILPMALH